MRPRLMNTIGGLALAGLSLTFLTLTQAPAHASGPEAWAPVTQGSFTSAAGTYCSFAFSYTPDQQNIRGRVNGRYADGTVRSEEFTGLLIGTTTNLSTGATIQTNTSGRVVETFNLDGSLATYETFGPVGFGFHAGDGFPQGYYVLDGHHRITFSGATRTMALDQGNEQNLCTALA